MSARTFCVKVDGHEKHVLALYRAALPQYRDDVDALLGKAWLGSKDEHAWKRESRTLKLGSFSISYISRFVEAARRIAGVVRVPDYAQKGGAR